MRFEEEARVGRGLKSRFLTGLSARFRMTRVGLRVLYCRETPEQ
jgi:hypothetical protein